MVRLQHPHSPGYQVFVGRTVTSNKQPVLSCLQSSRLMKSRQARSFGGECDCWQTPCAAVGTKALDLCALCKGHSEGLMLCSRAVSGSYLATTMVQSQRAVHDSVLWVARLRRRGLQGMIDHQEATCACCMTKASSQWHHGCGLCTHDRSGLLDGCNMHMIHLWQSCAATVMNRVCQPDLFKQVWVKDPALYPSISDELCSIKCAQIGIAMPA